METIANTSKDLRELQALKKEYFQYLGQASTTWKARVCPCRSQEQVA
jgi:hypothetical protein